MTILTIVKEPCVFVAGAVVAVISPSDVTAMTVAIGAFVTAGGAAIVNIIIARSAARQRELQGEKIDQTLRKTEVIEGHVNSEKTKAAGEIAALQKENALLREIMADKKETASLLAQAAAVAATALSPSAPPPQSVKPTEQAVLKKIEKNTAETAENTAATDATVEEIKSKQ